MATENPGIQEEVHDRVIIIKGQVSEKVDPVIKKVGEYYWEKFGKNQTDSPILYTLMEKLQGLPWSIVTIW